ncbi:MAG TPA: hypothetical protein PK440_04110 [Candidatus Accumulibacter phosphatis]|nr:hypothetical protein [Candidatus Accumulibacter phosphatis]
MGRTWAFVDHRVAKRPVLTVGLGADSEWLLVTPDEGEPQLGDCAAGNGDLASAFVAALAEAPGVPLATSPDAVGHATLRGDWRRDVGRTTSVTLPALEWHGLLGRKLALAPYSFLRTTGDWRNGPAFAALKNAGSVVTCGLSLSGDDSRAVAATLAGATGAGQTFSTGGTAWFFRSWRGTRAGPRQLAHGGCRRRPRSGSGATGACSLKGVL